MSNIKSSDELKKYNVDEIDSKYHTFFIKNKTKREIDNGLHYIEYTLGNPYINLNNHRSLHNGNIIVTNKENLLLQSSFIVKLILDEKYMVENGYSTNTNEYIYVEDNLSLIGKCDRDSKTSHEEKERNPYIFSSDITKPLILELMNSTSIDGDVYNLVFNREENNIFLEKFNPENNDLVLMSDIVNLNNKFNGYMENYIFKDENDKRIHTIMGKDTIFMITWKYYKKTNELKIYEQNILNLHNITQSLDAKLTAAIYVNVSINIIIKVTLIDENNMAKGFILIHVDNKFNTNTLDIINFEELIDIKNINCFESMLYDERNNNLIVSCEDGYIRKFKIIINNSSIILKGYSIFGKIRGLVHDDESYIKDGVFYRINTVNVPIIKMYNNHIITLYNKDLKGEDNSDFSISLINNDKIKTIKSLELLIDDISHHASLMWDIIEYKCEQMLILALVTNIKEIKIILINFKELVEYMK